MSKRGRSKPPKKKPKPNKWKFHVPGKGNKAGFKAGRKGHSLLPRKVEERHVRLAVRPSGKWSFNDPAKVAPVKKRDGPWWTMARDRYAELPGTGVRHEVPLEEEWDCKYNCKPFVWLHGQLHGHACPYWNNEGASRTPF